MSLVKSILKSTGNEHGSIVSDGIVGDLCGFISTGSYSLNALISGSIFNGIPSNKVTAIAGPSGVGKTFYVMQVIKSFLDADPENEVAYFESESALTQEMMENLKIDTTRIAFLPVTTIQEYRFQSLKVLEEYEKAYGRGHKEPKILMVLDSLGNLSTTKEVTDMADGKETLDMTRAKLIRGAFRVLTLKMGVLNVPLLITNHTYDTIDMFSKRVMGGGSGLVYAASTVIFLFKSKEKIGTDVVGAVIKARLEKSRLTKEQQKVSTRLFFDKGLDPYYGLAEIAIATGVWTKLSKQIEFPDGTKAFISKIEKNPEKYFTEEVLKAIDDKCMGVFGYGTPDVEIVSGDEETG